MWNGNFGKEAGFFPVRALCQEEADATTSWTAFQPLEKLTFKTPIVGNNPTQLLHFAVWMGRSWRRFHRSINWRRTAHCVNLHFSSQAAILNDRNSVVYWYASVIFSFLYKYQQLIITFVPYRFYWFRALALRQVFWLSRHFLRMDIFSWFHRSATRRIDRVINTRKFASLSLDYHEKY